MKVLLIVMLLCWSGSSMGQAADNTDRKNDTNIYYQAIAQYLKRWGNGGRAVPDTIYIERSMHIGDSLLKRNGPTNLFVLDYDDIQNLVKSDKAIVLHRVSPITFENGQFSITLVPFLVRREGEELSFTNPGNYSVFFDYKDGKFFFVKVESFVH